jgi:Family of unknown function (DUF6297)
VSAAGTDADALSGASADWQGGLSWPAVPVRLLRRRLRAGGRNAARARRSWLDVYVWALAVVVVGAVAAELLRPLFRLLTGPGRPLPGAPGPLFVVAAVMLLLGLLAQALRAGGPVTASSAFRFWLLAAPVRRSALLRRRFLAVIAAVAVVACVAAVVIAHAASVAVLPVVGVAALATVTVTAGAIWGQASDATERAVHVVGRALGAVSVLGFGSLATGVGRAGADSVLRAPTAALVVLMAALAVAALAVGWRAYRALDRIDVSVLSSGEGLWTAGQAAAASLDVFMLTEFLAEQRARTTGRVRSIAMGPRFAIALARSEWTRVRRRPQLALQAVAAAVVWWGCRPVLPAGDMSAAAVVAGFLLILPLGSALKQLAANPGLRVQFAPNDRWLTVASAGVCLLAAAVWTAIMIPGMVTSAVIGIIMPLGITAAAWRTLSRPPLDYSKPPVPTPFGDIPVDLFRQVLRGPLLLAVLVIIVVHAH